MAAEKGTESTSKFMRKLFKTTDIKHFLETNAESLCIPPFHEYISEKCCTMNLAPERVILRAGLDRVYGHQIFQGIRRPSRDKVLQLAFGFELDPEEAQLLLRAARHMELYPKIMRDAAILFALQRKMSFIDIQNMLDELGLQLLGGRENA